MQHKSTANFWTGRRVLVTGHTGFKGAWLSLLLGHLGAKVCGYALEAPTNPSLFALAGLREHLAATCTGDVLDLDRLAAEIARHQPEIVFHLAAQSLVRESYRTPLPTFAVNAIGTANLLEAVRRCPTVRAALVVTTDKCYENAGTQTLPFREDDKLGGHDPYSASKACAEIIAQSYRRSFFSAGIPALATARAGNVIGGGDWAADRILPDFFRAAAAGAPLTIRQPEAVRPWQHVLDALGGYLALAEALHAGGGEFAGAWNFGPAANSFATVREVVALAAEFWGGPLDIRAASVPPDLHEAAFLTLDSTKAMEKLSWCPRWNFRQAVAATVAWHRAVCQGRHPHELCLEQIRDYLENHDAGQA